jgi:hypothetical protein
VHVSGIVVALTLERLNVYGPPVNGFGINDVAIYLFTPDTAW